MTIINCDDCKEYEVINREQAEQIAELIGLVDCMSMELPKDYCWSNKLREKYEQAMPKAAQPQEGSDDV